jgi:hypothetical protein
MDDILIGCSVALMAATIGQETDQQMQRENATTTIGQPTNQQLQWGEKATTEKGEEEIGAGPGPQRRPTTRKLLAKLSVS